MTDSKSITPAKESKSQQKDSAPAKPSTTSAKKPFPWFVLLTFVLVLASAGYFQYRLELLLGENLILKQQQAVMDGKLKNQIQQNAGQAALMEKADQMQQGLDQKLMGLNSIVQQLPGARSEDWKLAEIEYLLRLANQRLQLQQEVSGAEALMKAADTILAELDDPALLLVRELIAKERAALGEAKSFDRQGIYLKLQALKNQIKTSIEPPEHYIEEKSTADVSAESQTEPESESSSIWQQLKVLVQVRHRDEAFDAPLRQSQYQLLEHSLLLMIEQAQWALLKQEQTLYKESLQNAINWIDGKLRHAQAQTLQSELETLSALTITQTLPEISASLRQLRSVMSARTYRPVIPEKETNSDSAKPSNNSTKSVTAKQEQA